MHGHMNVKHLKILSARTAKWNKCLIGAHKY